MSDTSNMVMNAAKAARTAISAVMPESIITLRFDEREYSGIGGTLEQIRESDNGGTIYRTTGYVRLIISELPERLPKSGDKVQVKGADGLEWITRILTTVRKDEAGATLYCGYGERYD